MSAFFCSLPLPVLCGIHKGACLCTQAAKIDPHSQQARQGIFPGGQAAKFYILGAAATHATAHQHLQLATQLVDLVLQLDQVAAVCVALRPYGLVQLLLLLQPGLPLCRRQGASLVQLAGWAAWVGAAQDIVTYILGCTALVPGGKASSGAVARTNKTQQQSQCMHAILRPI